MQIIGFSFLILASLLISMCHCDASSDVKDAFAAHEIVPDVLDVAPSKLISVVYPSGVSANLGQELTPTQVKDKPSVTWQADNDAFYTLILTDPDAPSRAEPKAREFRHWLVMNIPGSDVHKGDEVIGFIGSGAPKGTGLHRYVFLVYKQPNGKIEHTEPRSSKRSRNNRPKTSASALSRKYNLGEPEFGNFYQAQYDAYVDVLHAQLSE